MPGNAETNGNHHTHEAKPHAQSHERETHSHDKAVPAHDHSDGHSALIHSLSRHDWQGHLSAARTPARADAAHLPKTEISASHKGMHYNPQGSDQHNLQHALMDSKQEATHRLAAAHKLYEGHTSDFVDHDARGKIVHLRIAEIKQGKDTHIVVSQTDGRTSSAYLEGTLDASGKFSASGKSTAGAKQSISGRHQDGGETHQSQFHRAHHNDDSDVHARAQSRAHANGHSAQRHAENFTPQPPPAQPQDSYRDSGMTFQTAPAPGDIAQRFEQAQAHTGAAIDKMMQLPDGSVYMRTHLRVDADGGTEWRTDPCGQASTSLRNADGAPLDAKHVNFFVLPMGDKWKQLGIKLGDIAWVRNAANGRIVPAVFGDLGPHGKIGEGSQGLCRALGLSDNPNHGGTSEKNIEFIIVPRSGTGKGDIARDPTQMAARLTSIQGDSYGAVST